MVRLACFLSAASLLAACGAEPELGATEQDVIGGQAVASDDFPAVGAFLTFSEGRSAFICTSTLIGPDLVLTAAHCVHPDLIVDDEGEPLPDVTFAFVRRVSVRGAIPENQFLAVRETVFHPDFDISCLGQANTDGCNDIALAVLADPQPGPFQSLGTTEMVAALEAGDAVEVVGYGLTDASNENSNGVLRRGEITIDEILPEDIGAGRESSQNTCFGDSGGPLLVRVGDVLEQVGVTSRGYADVEVCDGGQYTRVDPYLPWIEESASALGATLRASADEPADETPADEKKSGGCSTAPDGAILFLLLAGLWMWRRSATVKS